MVELIVIDAPESMDCVTPHLGVRRAVLAWRDFWIDEVSHTTAREAKALWVDLEDIAVMQGVFDRVFRNDAVVRSERHIADWTSLMQGRLLDAAVSDLEAVMSQELTAEKAQPFIEGARSNLLDIGATASAGRLKEATKQSGSHLRIAIAEALDGENASVRVEIEHHLRRLCSDALAYGKSR